MGEMKEDSKLNVESLQGAMEDDELLDLNKEPLDRKRKRAEKTSPANKKKGSLDGSTCVSGRVLRSMTMAMNNAEKQVIEKEVAVKEEVDLVMKAVSPERKKMKVRHGRLPKVVVDNSDSGSSIKEEDDKVMEGENSEESCKGAGSGRKKVKGQRGRPRKMEIEISCAIVKKKRKGRPGRPPKMDNAISEMVIEDKKRRGRPPKMESTTLGIVVQEKMHLGRQPRMVTRNSKIAKKKKIKGLLGRLAKTKKTIVDGTNVKAGKSNPICSPTSFEPEEPQKIEPRELMQLGRREQQQLARDQIVSLLKKAGWTIEYRPRQSRNYNDPVYVDQDGKGYWSCTLAYNVFKQKIEAEKADGKGVSRFSPIPDELLSTLYRVRKNEGKKKVKGTGKTVKHVAKQALPKIKALGRSIKSRSGKGKGTLLARRPGEGSDDFELYDGKRTLLSWMIDLGTLTLDAKVKYKRGRNQKVMLQGKITRDGICCSCCDKIYTIWGFESHAKTETRDPYKYIYLESGSSLLQCLIDSWNKQLATDHIGFISVDVDGNDPNDDTCNICGDGGNLICCDGCPSTFHQGCLCGKVPSGDWYCTYCSCKFCEVPGGSASLSDDNSDSIVSELSTCQLCEEKCIGLTSLLPNSLHTHSLVIFLIMCMGFLVLLKLQKLCFAVHVSCIEVKDAIDSDNNNPSFCQRECQKIFERLQELIGIRQELEGEYSYTILQRRDISHNVSVSDSLEIESNSKLAVAFSVMDECFLPIIDERSKINVIHNVVYSCGSNFRRLNFGGFYTIILEMGDELVAVASIRIHGSKLAEMPFIGTRYTYRRQGMCRRLLTAIELVLGALNVDKMVIPAISELNKTWTKVFGFTSLEDSERQEMRFMSMVVFPGTAMLQKPIVKHESAEGHVVAIDEELTEAPSKHQDMQEEPTDNRSCTAAPDAPTLEVEIPNLNEAAAVHKSSEAEISSINEATAFESRASVPDCSINVSENENGLILVDNPSTKSKTTSTGDAHKLETQISVEEMNSCPNGIILDRKLVKCN